jgi:hypothetical protein
MKKYICITLLHVQVPPAWTKLAYASLNGLSAWYADLLLRIKELESWTSDFNLPSSVWLPGFFNPQSFLTAIMQSTARKNELPLDRMCLVCEVTKKQKEEVTQAPREGAYIHGLFMEVWLYSFECVCTVKVCVICICQDKLQLTILNCHYS